MNPPSPWRSPLVRAVLWFELLLLLLLAVGLWASQRQTRAAELQVLQVVARAVAERVDGTLQAAQAALATSAADAGADAAARSNTPAAQQVLRQRALALPMFDTMAVVDGDGRVLVAARETESTAMPVRITLQADDGATRFVLGPVQVLSTDGQARSVLAAMAPWRSADGGRGWVVALIEPDFFAQAFRQLDPDRAALIALWSDSGQSLADSGTDANIDAGAIASLLARSDVARAGAMPPQLLHAQLQHSAWVLQPLPGHRLVVALSLGLDPVLRSWRAQAGAVGALTLAVLALLLGLALRSARHAERVRAAEFAARESATRLAERMKSGGKMEALGTLAGGIAHDFNNLLAAVIGFGEMAQDAAPLGSAQARHLDQVLQAGQRGRALVDRILAYSRAGERPVVRFAAQPVVHEVLALLRGAVTGPMRVAADLQAADAQLEGDSTLLFECTMNLCTNALHAMPQGGELRVALDCVTLAQSQQLSHGLARPGAHLRLRVADAGVGIPPEVLPRMFEPFFSTRSAADNPQGGTGLGLAVVWGAVVDLGGAIDVQTALGQGSTFTLLLPLAGAGDAQVPDAVGRDDGATVTAAGTDSIPPHVEPLSVGGQGQTVMLVDDELALVALGEELLASLGYEPVGFTSAEAALAALQRDPQRFDLLLSDQVMPGMSGLELARAARRLRPALPIVLVSGYGGSDFAGQAAAAGASAALAKPVARAALAQVLAQLLSQPLAEALHAPAPGQPAPRSLSSPPAPGACP